MEYLTGFILLILVSRTIYSTSASMSTNYRLRYFRLPPVSTQAPATQTVHVFKSTLREILNKFIWLGLFAFFMSSIIYLYGLNGLMLLVITFLFPFFIRLIPRLIHLNDKIIVHHDYVEFIKLFSTLKIKFAEIESVQLRYYQHRSGMEKSLYIELFFKLTKGEETVKLSKDFFLDKAENILVAIQNGCPEKNFSIKWDENSSGKEETLTLQPVSIT